MDAAEFVALQRAIATHLRADDRLGGTDLSNLREVFPAISPDLLEKALQGLRAKGIVRYEEFLGPDGLTGIELTAAGLEWDPGSGVAPGGGPSAVGVTVNGGNVQIGNFNRQAFGGSRRQR